MTWDKISGDSVTHRLKTYCISNYLNVNQDDILWKIILDDPQSGSKGMKTELL